jgi:importin-4
MKGAVTPSTEPLLDLLYSALGDEDDEVRSNAAYATGLLVEHSEKDLSPQYLILLSALRPLFGVAPDAPSARINAQDNAAGAVARLILRNTAAVPLDQVLPVFIEALPLKNDYLENRPVFQALFHLFRTNPQSLLPSVSRLLPIFSHVLDPNGPEQIDEETRVELLNLIEALKHEGTA